MVGNFYHQGRQDALSKLLANPSTAGAANTTDYNEYMNGYNSVQELFRDIHKIIRAPKIKDLTLVLTESLVSSLDETADKKTNLDEKISAYLAELSTHDEKLSEGIRKLYNAVQKSKRYKLASGEKTKQLNKNKQ